MSDEIGGSGLGTVPLAGSLFRDPPVVVVTAPDGPQTTETVTVTWTYTSSLSKPQYSYRVQVLNQYGTTVLYDSGAILGTDLSFACPFLLSSGSQYQAKVICSDGVDLGDDALAFTATFEDLTAYTPSTDVGSIYEIAINGQGYRLADNPQRPYKRSTGQLQAPRLATGDTPFSEAIERYTFLGTGDWSFGAGQEVGSRSTSDSRAFFESESVNPFGEDLQLLPATEELFASGSSVSGAVVASGELYAATASDTVKHMATSVAAIDTMTFTGETIQDMASDGTYWYVGCQSEKIYRGTTTTIGAAWADLSAVTSQLDLIEWCSDRLAVVYTNGSGQSVLSTLSPAGAEEVASGRFLYTDATITAVCSGDGFLWFAVNRDDRSAVYAWQLGSTDSAFIALDLPKGEWVTELFFYLGNVMVRCGRDAGGVIYRAVPQAGELTPERVVELEGAGTDVGPFSANGKLVFFGWKAMGTDGRSGVGAIDLSTSGWCRWLQAATASDTGAVNDVFVWEGEVGFLVDGSGPQFTDTGGALEPTGYLTSSVFDLASSLTKVFDSIEVTLEPLAANSTVSVAMSFDALTSYVEIGSVSTAGARDGLWAVERTGPSVAVRVTLTTSGVTSPKVKMTQVKLHPLSIVDSIVELPISCADRQDGLNGVEIFDDVSGLDRARILESLVGTRVLFQDVDYPVTGQADAWEMVAAEYTSVGIFERGSGHRREAQAVCVCTLRRAG